MKPKDHTTFLNWNPLFLFLKNKEFIRNNSLNHSFWNDWKKLLIELEKEYIELDLPKKSPVQFYPLEFLVSVPDFPYTFKAPIKIPPIIDAIQKEQLSTRSFRTEEFGTRIQYDTDFTHKKFDETPIIILKDYILNDNYVVDGNTRVKYIKDNNIPSILAYGIDSKFLLRHPSCFITQFSYALYCFLFDINQLSRAPQNVLINKIPINSEKKYLESISTIDLVKKANPHFKK